MSFNSKIFVEYGYTSFDQKNVICISEQQQKSRILILKAEGKTIMVKDGN